MSFNTADVRALVEWVDANRPGMVAVTLKTVEQRDALRALDALKIQLRKAKHR
jgi:hypothetical protein